jgi:hypothetical protein
VFARAATRFFKNGAQPDIIKRNIELVGVSEAFDFLLPLFCTDGFRPDPRELGIVNRADILLFQFGFDVIDKFAHSKKSSVILGTFKDGRSNQFIQTTYDSIPWRTDCCDRFRPGRRFLSEGVSDSVDSNEAGGFFYLLRALISE